MTVTGVGLGPVIPWGASDRKVQTGDLIVVDFGVCYQGYHCDIARTYSVGKPTSDQQDLWDRLLDLHFKVIDKIKPGVTGHELYVYAEQLAKENNLDEYFMGVKEQRGTYIGHSIGLEMDELPVLAEGVH